MEFTENNEPETLDNDSGIEFDIENRPGYFNRECMGCIQQNNLKICKDAGMEPEKNTLKNSEKEDGEEIQFEIFRFLKDTLESKFKISILEQEDITDCGTYGDVLTAKSVKGTEKLAVRVVENDHVHRFEVMEWPQFKHSNVLKLLHVQHLPELDAHVFVTQNHSLSLETLLRDDCQDYFRITKTFYLVEKWLRGILRGLEYLHALHFCHLGLDLKSIFISGEFSAVIGNFRCLDTTTGFSDRYDVPYDFKPPEAWRISEKIPVDGTSFDMWCYGILAMKVFTRAQKLSKETDLDEPICWWSGVYDDLFKNLEEDNLYKLIKRSYPSSNVDRRKTRCVRNFITSCLRLRPVDRPTAAQLVEHKCLKTDGHLLTQDELWENKVCTSYPSFQRKSRLRRTLHWLKKKAREVKATIPSCFC